jgi:dihydrolipoamide dehydrogenase
LLTDLGTHVTLLEALPQVIPGAEPDCARALARALQKRGVKLATGVRVTGWEKGGAGAVVAYEEKGEVKGAEVEKILVSVGRGPVTKDIGLEAAGVAADQKGFVEIDRTNMRTSANGVWSVGDCVNTPGLAHVAFAEAMVAIRDIVGEDPQPIDYDKVPLVVYSHPEVAWAGMTEEQAKAAGLDVEVHKHNFGGVGRAMIIGETDGFVKLVAVKDGGPIVGVHIVGPWASELIAEGYLAVNWEATGADVGHYTHAHPTLSEAMGEAALALTGRSLHG